jgi:chromosome segregation ATPase
MLRLLAVLLLFAPSAKAAEGAPAKPSVETLQKQVADLTEQLAKLKAQDRADQALIGVVEAQRNASEAQVARLAAQINLTASKP